jgi:CRP-like cAMP-binding protein
LGVNAFEAGSLLFSQGQPATHLYLLLRGKVTIRFKPDDGEPITVAELEPGGVFGWSAALGRGRYTSGAICQESSETLVISGAALRRLCQVDPETGVLILERLAEVIAERLRPRMRGRPCRQGCSKATLVARPDGLIYARRAADATLQQRESIARVAQPTSSTTMAAQSGLSFDGRGSRSRWAAAWLPALRPHCTAGWGTVRQFFDIERVEVIAVHRTVCPSAL